MVPGCDLGLSIWGTPPTCASQWECGGMAHLKSYTICTDCLKKLLSLHDLIYLILKTRIDGSQA